MTWRVWFSAVGASQEPRRPWAAKDPDGVMWLAARIEDMHGARTLFDDKAFMDLPGGPRGIVEAESLTLFDAVQMGEA